MGKPGGEEDGCGRSSNPTAPPPMMKWAGLSVESERDRESEGGFRKGTLCEAGRSYRFPGCTKDSAGAGNHNSVAVNSLGYVISSGSV